MITKSINWLIGKWGIWKYGFTSSVILTESSAIHTLYSKVAELSLKLAFAEAKLHELGYDFETGDTFNPEYEQEFAELTPEGEWIEAEVEDAEMLRLVKKPKKEEMN